MLNEQVQAYLENVTHSRELAIILPLRVTNAQMDKHLIKLSKSQSLIQSFLANLKRDMKILSQNSTTHEVTLERLRFHRIISISDYNEVHTTYIRDKDEG